MQDTPDRPYHHGDLRRAVIETAMGMLHEDRGWQFTLREVARRAGVSHAAPYKHFPDKAALLAEMALVGFDRLREALTAAKPADAKFLTRRIPRRGAGLCSVWHVQSGPLPADVQRGCRQAVDVHLKRSGTRRVWRVDRIAGAGPTEGVVRRRDMHGQAAACWALMHGITMLTIDGLLLPEKVGPESPGQRARHTGRRAGELSTEKAVALCPAGQLTFTQQAWRPSLS